MTAQQLQEVRALLKTALEILASVSGDGEESRTSLPVAPDVLAPAIQPDAGWHEKDTITPVLRPLGACGLVTADERYACIKDVGHAGPHGDDPASSPLKSASFQAAIAKAEQSLSDPAKSPTDA